MISVRLLFNELKESDKLIVESLGRSFRGGLEWPTYRISFGFENNAQVKACLFVIFTPPPLLLFNIWRV